MRFDFVTNFSHDGVTFCHGGVTLLFWKRDENCHRVKETVMRFRGNIPDGHTDDVIVHVNQNITFKLKLQITALVVYKVTSQNDVQSFWESVTRGWTDRIRLTRDDVSSLPPPPKFFDAGLSTSASGFRKSFPRQWRPLTFFWRRRVSSLSWRRALCRRGRPSLSTTCSARKTRSRGFVAGSAWRTSDEPR